MVAIIMSVQSTYAYISTKNKIIQEMKRSSSITISSLQKNITNLMASYAVNEYDNLILNEIELRSHFAIVVEDYNMGKIIGKESYISGKIQGPDGKIINFDPQNSEQASQLKQVFYSDKDNIVSALGKKLGTVTIYISNQSMNKELNTIIINTIINSIIISLILILSLFITIRFFILKPVSNIILAMSNCDDEGIPIELIPSHGSTEIFALAHRMNNMIFSIRDSRVKLEEQYEGIKVRDEQILTLSMATEQSPVSILICSPDNIIEYANPQFEKTSGFELNEVIGLSIETLFQHNERDQNQVVELKTSQKDGKTWVGEITPLTRQGDNYIIRMSASPISDETGSTSHHIFVAEDITEQKRNEEMLRYSQKMDAIGQLTGGIAHDFNNLLGIIMGNLELLKMDLINSPDELEKIESALAGTVRGAQLTRKLLNFTRQSHKEQELNLINPFIENLRELISKSVTTSIKVETHLADNLWPVKIDPGDLEDAILNLSLNAKDAMPDGGLLVIETANKHLDADYVKQNPNVSIGDYVMVSVSDTGTGINEETRKKIFDPFYSTKEFGKGTGLGLSMVYGFVQRSGGHIQVYTEEGNGCTFHIYIPRSLSEHDEQTNIQQTELPHGDETILIVDDEKKLCETAKSYLQRLGYRTLQANSGKEALEILSTTESVNLVFSDVIMPGMNGYELAFEVVKQWPDIKIQLTSGFTSKRMEYSNGRQKTYLSLSENLLGKPYNLSEIAFAVRRTLDDAESK